MDPNEEAPSKRTLLRRRARARAAKHRQMRAVSRLCLACRVMIAIRRWRRRTFEVDPYEAFFSTMESMEMKDIEEKKSDAKISEEKSHDDFEIYGESEVYEELLHQFQLRLRGMPLEWPQSKREMVHRALQFAVAEREALSLELIRLRWEVLVVKLLSWLPKKRASKAATNRKVRSVSWSDPWTGTALPGSDTAPGGWKGQLFQDRKHVEHCADNDPQHQGNQFP